MVLIVKAPATVTAPLNLLVPSTPSVVEGEAVPMPMRFSLAFTTRVSVSKTEDQVKVEEAVEERAEKAPLTLKVESKVEEASTKMPAVVEVGVRASPAKVDSQAPLCPAGPPTPSPQPVQVPTVKISAERYLKLPTTPRALFLSSGSMT
jgi:hypothetical protein